MEKQSYTKKFKCVSVSENRNSFGLQGCIIVAPDGEAWEVGANYLNAPKKGDEVNVPFLEKDYFTIVPSFASLGFEIPKRLKDPPKELLREFFPEK